MRTNLSRSRNFLIVCVLALGENFFLPAQTPSDAKALIHRFYLASGGDRWAALAQCELSGEFNLGGVAGSFHQVIDLKKGRDVMRVDAGPIQMTQASLEDSSWQADSIGLVTYSDIPTATMDAINQSFQDRNGWFSASEKELSYLGTRQDHGKSFEVVAVTPTGGRKMTLWLGAADHLLYRIDQQNSTHHESDTLYSDYREIDGVRIPFLIRQTNGDASQDVVLTVQKIRFSPTADPAAFAAPVSTFKDARLMSEQNSVTVPFTIEDGNILVDVSIDGHPAAPFLLDTGGSNYMTPEAAKLLGVKGNGNFALDGTGAAQENGQFAKVNQLRLGPVEMRDQRFILGPLPKILTDRGKEAPIAGLVGAELLRRFPTTINYQQKTLTFYKPGTVPPAEPNAQSFRLYFDGYHPYLEVGVNGVPGVFGIDTGDSGYTTLFGAFYWAHAFPVEQPALKVSQGGVGGRGEALRTRIGSLGFGPWELEEQLVTLNFAKQGVFSVDSIAGNLGYEILKNFVFTLDYEHRTGSFQRSSEFGKPADYNRSGMTLDQKDDGKVTVERVQHNAPAEQAGIRVGDTILSINGKKPQQDVSLDALGNLLYGKAGTQIDVLYSRQGETRHAVFQLKELLPVHGAKQPIVQDQAEK